LEAWLEAAPENRKSFFMWIVIFLNALLAASVLWLTGVFWRWRRQLACLAQQLEASAADVSLMPQQVRYSLARRRFQIAQTQLTLMSHLALWQKRSRQLKQLKQLIRLLQLALLSRKLR